MGNATAGRVLGDRRDDNAPPGDHRGCRVINAGEACIYAD